jgi:hypothetical protein
MEASEAKYSADELRQMADKGHAMRNDSGEPSYPIADKADLAKAIKAVGRGSGDHEAIRRHIIKRAAALDAADMIPDDWQSSGTQRSEAAQVAEEISLVEATRGGALSGRRMQIKLIDAGWGSSGYYSPAVLRQAAADGVFPAGTQMFLDHPGATESADRPERSVRDLAAATTSDATFKDGALWAEAEVFPPFREVLAAQANHIGVSIRAAGTAEPGEADGRRGMVITGLTEGISVDFVTKAGRGGQIVEVLESARAQAETHNVPDGPPPAQPITEGAPMTGTTPGAPDGGATQLSEADRLRETVLQLKEELAEARLEAAKRGDQARELAEAKNALEESRREVLRLKANDAARAMALKTLAESTLPDVAHEVVVESVTGANVPLTDEGGLDEARLVEAIREGIEQQRRYLARFAESQGFGQVRGLGSTSDGPSEADVDAELAAAFEGLSMSESATRLAVNGRGR